MKNIFVVLTLLVLSSCYGGATHATVKYHMLQGKIKSNNANFTRLSLGQSKAEALEIMGQPEKSEAYEWGLVLLYRTSIDKNVFNNLDNNFTPLVFSPEEKLLGWGRNFYTTQAKKYELKIN